MDFQISHFCLMDYDTYHQVMGGSFLEYIQWLNSMKIVKLENFFLQELEGKEEIQSSTSSIDISAKNNQSLPDIFLFLLELMGSHYGNFSPSINYKNMSTEEKIQELFSFYSSVGMNQEDMIGMVKRYLKSLGKVK